MNKLNRADLWSLEKYAQERPAFREAVMAHKKNRQLALGEHARLYFEDETTVRYQVQEMLRIEKVFEAEGIQDELDAYNPMIPDGRNWKATFMLEYDDVSERQKKVYELRGIEKNIWVQVAGFDKVRPIANEDLDRDDGERTSTVHFLRFEFSSAMITAARNGTAITAGIDHPAMNIPGTIIDSALRASLIADWRT